MQRYFRETTGELRKVSWPTWPEARRLTGLVLLVMLVMGLFLAGVDYAAAQLMDVILGL
ncbi:MAG: preprotein translocase subunit SecE [Chloroflexi bacterium]|nr:preprotein translocase subunit SecE [Chloroflexota bacterium]MDL1942590.1 preprotein translocase subunit SecE [Chloroflexi bacterium CFX2]